MSWPMSKSLQTLLAGQLGPRHCLLELRGHRIEGIVLALDPCPLEALFCKQTNIRTNIDKYSTKNSFQVNLSKIIPQVVTCVSLF